MTEKVRESLREVVENVYILLLKNQTAIEAAVMACQLLEDNPLFNSGTGSVLQSDGQIRMSAALMDGVNQRFSGVINVSNVQHPIDLALALQDKRDRVLSDIGLVKFLREQQISVYDPLTDARLQEWLRERKQNLNPKMAELVLGDDLEKDPRDIAVGTTGVVALDTHGNLAAGTSTGGKGFERVGRVSDSAMPAGTYATSKAAVSCTGVGEDIIEEGLATRIVVRVTDGLSLKDAFQRTFAEARNNKRYFGAIGIDETGDITWDTTSEVLLAAYHDGAKIKDTLTSLGNWT